MTQDLEKINQNNIADIEAIKQTMDGLYSALSEKPKPSAIKKNPYANNAAYLPIGYVEAQLDRLFLSWDWVVNSVQLIANGIVVTGTLTVLPATGKAITRSGVAGVEIQTKKGATTLSPDSLAAKAMDRDPGRAEAYALKNAASKLGNAFGRGLNREFNHEHVAADGLMEKVFGKQK